MIEVRDRVRFVETDMMGVVHHANYLRWFEMGRTAYLRNAGVGLLDLIKDGYIFPMMEIKCEYKTPARFDDEIIIRTNMAEFTKVKMTFSYEIIRQVDGVLLAVGRTTNAFTNQEGEITRLSNNYYDRIASLYEQDTKGRNQ
ncbi:MAG: acyl-CoA thioesterase [Acidaminococcaceae bacterium]